MTQYHDFATHAADQKEIAYYTQSFILHPKQLQGLQLPVSLAWQRIPFLSHNATSVTEKPGVYAFVIQHEAQGLPPHGYIAYIGQTGAKRKDRTLRDRFKDYFGERKRPKRPRIYELLNKWEECLVFHFARIDPGVANLLDIEAKLNDAIMPPYSQQDFSAEIRMKKQIWDAS